MVPIKIECECGQRYAFDVEPVNGKISSSVACPTCGADGTVAANEIIAREFPPVELAQSPVRIAPSQNSIHRATSSAPTNVKRGLLPGQMPKPQAESEARAKAMWGDSKDEVTKFLMLHSFTLAEAQDVVKSVFQERTAAVRANGIKKIITGAGLMCVPIFALFFFLHLGFIPIKIFGVTIVIGLWGVWLLLNGIIMAAMPKLEKSDVADQ